jgi:hypothetical protein
MEVNQHVCRSRLDLSKGKIGIYTFLDFLPQVYGITVDDSVSVFSFSLWAEVGGSGAKIRGTVGVDNAGYSDKIGGSDQEKCIGDPRTHSVGTYPPIRISKDILYVILLSCDSRRMDSGALDEDLEERYIYLHQSIYFLLLEHTCCPLNCVHST